MVSDNEHKLDEFAENWEFKSMSRKELLKEQNWQKLNLRVLKKNFKWLEKI